jgi:hypothetical protein
MTTDDPRDLLAAYAVDAVDDVERRAVERLVAADPEAARELASLTATAAMLGAAASATPPPELRSSVLSEILRSPQAGPVAPAASAPAASAPAGVSEPALASAGTSEPAGADAPPRDPLSAARARSAQRRGVPRRTVWLAVAATALGAATIPSAVAWQQVQQTHRVEREAAAVADLLADPSVSVVRADVAGGGTAVGVLTDQRALFTASGLADPGAGKSYQLWVMRDGVPVPDAVMADDGGRVRAITDQFATGDGLAVTIEPAAGSEHPTSDVLVALSPA